LVSLSASAQDNSKVDLFGGYSYLMFRPNATGVASKINFNGGIGSLSYNLNDWLAGVAEFGGYHAGTINSNTGVPFAGASVNALSYLFGPKIYMSKGKITPFAQVLFGGVHAMPSGFGSTAVNQNAFGLALGGGLDWNASPHFAVRLGQIEYLMTRFSNVNNGIGTGGTGTQNNFRYSAGVVFKF
jgi:hypothetical protein